jgi:hypothetical protein
MGFLIVSVQSDKWKKNMSGEFSKNRNIGSMNKKDW